MSLLRCITYHFNTILFAVSFTSKLKQRHNIKSRIIMSIINQVAQSARAAFLNFLSILHLIPHSLSCHSSTLLWLFSCALAVELLDNVCSSGTVLISPSIGCMSMGSPSSEPVYVPLFSPPRGSLPHHTKTRVYSSCASNPRHHHYECSAVPLNQWLHDNIKTALIIK